jgi:hypothetical protein
MREPAAVETMAIITRVPANLVSIFDLSSNSFARCSKMCRIKLGKNYQDKSAAIDDD